MLFHLRSLSEAVSGTLFDYQNARKMANGYRFRLTLFWEVGTISTNGCGRVVHNYIIKNRSEHRRHDKNFLNPFSPYFRVNSDRLSTEEALLAGRQVGPAYLVCYLRHEDRVFETYWTNGRGFEVMAPSYGLLDRTVYGRQETWEDSPAGWPQRWDITAEPSGGQLRTNGRPTAQWSRLQAGRSDDLGTAGG